MLLTVVGLVCLFEAPPSSATAITIGNGKIVFSSNGFGNFQLHISAMNADGSGLTHLTDPLGPGSDFEPDWSPDGCRIVFSSTRDGDRANIYVMNADGSNQTRITNDPAGGSDHDPSWSPDGAKIIFTRVAPTRQIIVMNADGSDQKVLLSRSDVLAVLQHPRWSPDGSKIIFWDTGSDRFRHVYVMDANGSHLTALTHESASDVSPSWSPDGRKILFERIGDNGGIYLMNADGSNQTKIGAGNFATWAPDGQKILFSRGPSTPTIFVSNTDGSNVTALAGIPTASLLAGLSWQPLHLAPTQNPTLLTEENSSRALALESVTFARDPFPLKPGAAFSPDQRTRISVFAMNISLQPGEPITVVTARVEDSQHRVFPVTVEYVGRIPNWGRLTQINLVLPDELAEGGDVWLSLNFRGAESNQALITIIPSPTNSP